MKKTRYLIPVLGILALITMFLKLPETQNVFGNLGCKTCSSGDPYLPLIGAAYFSVIIAVFLLFPTFPSLLIARGGLIWSVLLCLALTYVKLPAWCIDCLIGHACNIMIWTIWATVPPNTDEKPGATIKERLCMILFAPISVVALLSCLNLTFMAYGFKATHKASASDLQPGDEVPVFSMQMIHSGRSITNEDATKTRVIINFISPNCPFCLEQLAILNSIAPQLTNDSFHLINVSSILPSDLDQYSHTLEWVDDKDGKLRELFKVLGYPTMFILGLDGKIAEIIPAVPEHLKTHLLRSLTR